jgi:hypothetical protein
MMGAHSLRADRWALAHSQALRPHRVEELRYRAKAKTVRPAHPPSSGARGRLLRCKNDWFLGSVLGVCCWLAGQSKIREIFLLTSASNCQV